MEEKKTLIHYGEQVFLIFGFTVFVISCIDILAGDAAKGYSTMFRFGSQGIPTATLFQYFLSSCLIALLRFLFFTDIIVKKMSIPARTLGMVSAVLAISGLFAYLFGWFPINMPECWILFLCCFGVCFLLGAVISTQKEKLENRRLEQALQRRKEEADGNMDESLGDYPFLWKK